MQDQVTFADFQLDARIMSAIEELGYKTPTPIQAKAIPVVMQGRDVMGAAQTGTGKTAGYGLPAINRILPYANTSASPARHPVRVLILTPTRELADQVNANLVEYAAKTTVRVGVVYGGVDIKPQQEMMRRGVEVLTATPGRLLDHVEGRTVNLSQVEVLILDEADRMLDMGFLPDISRIINLLPARRQNLMFSATFSPEIKSLAQGFLNDPVIIEVARRNMTAETVKQRVLQVHDSEKTDCLIDILKGRMILDPEDVRQVLVFVNAKITCRRLARTLERVGVRADAIHGDKTQDERTAALNGFKSGDVLVLVATDVAARGLDIAELPCVINYDVPFSPEDYVHRIGRTGRAGAKGLALTLMTGADNRSVEAIEKLTKQTFKPEQVQVSTRASRNEERRQHARSRRWREDDGEAEL
ncbi:MAG: DEAD/DEAH box helicase, partial [Duodenibacillus sp.]|nr:DEAD/DEAH box helicase [Duodenibacillus sp.]